jgi:AcrR family transcriptional regulator
MEQEGKVTTTDSISVDELASPPQRDRRRRILDATIDLASRGGFDAVQMRAVAEQADVALGTLYRYFPSKIHLLVSALARQFGDIQAGLDKRPIPGDTPADRVSFVLSRVTRGMQRQPQLTEALTRAFMFADSSVVGEIHKVGIALTNMISKAIQGDDYVEGEQPTEEEISLARVISDVWLAALVSWTTGRTTADEVNDHLESAVRLILR